MEHVQRPPDSDSDSDSDSGSDSDSDLGLGLGLGDGLGSGEGDARNVRRPEPLCVAPGSPGSQPAGPRPRRQLVGLQPGTRRGGARPRVVLPHAPAPRPTRRVERPQTPRPTGDDRRRPTSYDRGRVVSGLLDVDAFDREHDLLDRDVVALAVELRHLPGLREAAVELISALAHFGVQQDPRGSLVAARVVLGPALEVLAEGRPGSKADSQRTVVGAETLRSLAQLLSVPKRLEVLRDRGASDEGDQHLVVDLRQEEARFPFFGGRSNAACPPQPAAPTPGHRRPQPQ